MLLLLLACADGREPADSGVEVTPWRHDPAASAPPLTAAEVEALAAPRLAELLAVDPFPLFEAYSLAMSGQSRDCPGTWEIAGVIGWGNTCTAPTGWSFDGRSQGLHGQDIVFDGVRYAEFGTLLSTALIHDPEGRALSLTGYADLQVLDTEGGGQTLYAWLLGTFTWEGMPEEDHWLRQPASLGLTLRAEVTAAGERRLSLEGGRAPLGVADPVTLTARGLLASSAAACTLEPSGELVLRAADGRRAVMAFGEGDCDGCAEAVFEGEALGPVCLDFTPMFTWEDRPW